MPVLEEMDCHEHVVVWAKTGDDHRSQPVVDYPQDRKARWVHRKGTMGDDKSNTIDWDAKVVIPCCDVAVGSVVWEGSMSDITGTAEPPEPTADLYVVVSINRARDLKGNVVRREYVLKRSSDSLPAVVRSEES